MSSEAGEGDDGVKAMDVQPTTTATTDSDSKEKNFESKGESSKPGSRAGSDSTEGKIHRHEAPWNIFATSWSRKGDKPYRLAIGSFVEEYCNKIQVLSLDPSTGNFTEMAMVDHPYPATKIMWMPDQENKYERDLIATTGDYLRIWRVKDDTVKYECLLNSNKSELFCAPLTSFDWCEHNPRLIGTSSIDTTCTIWNIEVGKPIATVGGSTDATVATAASTDTSKKVSGEVQTQLIAHDQEVYDISFQPKQDNIFASVGADGSVRMFDLRSLKHSRIIYEEEAGKQLLRLDWNRQDENYIATMKLDSPEVTILDIRSPPKPVVTLTNGHRKGVNGITWAPNSSCYVCTAGDDSKTLIWDISSYRPFSQEAVSPCLAYDAGGPINQVDWSTVDPSWIAINYGKTLEVLRV